MRRNEVKGSPRSTASGVEVGMKWGRAAQVEVLSALRAARASCPALLVALPINEPHGDEPREDHRAERVGALDERQPQVDPGLQRCLPTNEQAVADDYHQEDCRGQHDGDGDL